MAASLVRTLTPASKSGSSPLTIAIPAGVTIPAGDTLIVRVGCHSSLPTSITDTHSQTWATVWSSSSVTFLYQIVYRLYVTTPLVGDNGDTISIAYSGSQQVIAKTSQWNGVANATYDAISTIKSAATTSVSSNAVTPTQNGDLVLGLVFANVATGDTFTPAGGSWIALDNTGIVSNFSVPFGGYQIQSTAGAVSYTGASLSTSRNWVGIAIAFKAAVPAVTHLGPFTDSGVGVDDAIVEFEQPGHYIYVGGAFEAPTEHIYVDGAWGTPTRKARVGAAWQ